MRNTELKHWLQAMEQQSQLHDDNSNLAMQHLPYNQSTFFPNQPQSDSNDSQNVRTLPTSHQHHMLPAAHGQGLPNSMHQDLLGLFQGIDISNQASHVVKSEGPYF